MSGSKLGRTVGVVFAMVLATAAVAQPYPDRLYVGNGGCGRQFCYYGLWHVVAGQSTLLHTLNNSAIVTDVTNTETVIAGNHGFAVIDDRGAATFRRGVLVGTAPIAPHQDGDFVAATGAFLQVHRSLVTATTLRNGLPFGTAITRDLHTGGYALASGIGVLSLDQQGTLLSTLTGATYFTLVQSHLDGHFYATDLTTVFRIDRSGAVTTVSTAINGPGTGIAFDRAAGRGALVVANGQGTVYRFTPTGTQTSVLQTPAVVSPRVHFPRDRNLATERLGTNNHWAFRVSFPGEGKRRYLVGLSTTGFTPGIPVAERTVALVPDTVTTLGLSGALGGLWRGYAGTLDATGSARATLDLRRFGSSLRGLRIWGCAMTFDPAAPGGIATVSKPVVLVLE